MFFRSRPSHADTNQPIVLLKVWGNKKMQLVAGARKTISFDVCPQVAWWCKVTHQPGGVQTNPSNPPWIRPWNCIRIVPRTGEKFSCNVDIVSGFDLSGCSGGIHALKFVRPTQDWLSFIIWDRPKTDQKFLLKSIPEFRFIQGYSTGSGGHDVAAPPNNALSFTHVHSYISSNGRRVCFCTVHYVIVIHFIQWNRSLLNLLKLPPLLDHDDFLGPCMYFLVTSYTLTLYNDLLRGFVKGLRPFRASLAITHFII